MRICNFWFHYQSFHNMEVQFSSVPKWLSSSLEQWSKIQCSLYWQYEPKSYLSSMYNNVWMMAGYAWPQSHLLMLSENDHSKPEWAVKWLMREMDFSLYRLLPLFAEFRTSWFIISALAHGTKYESDTKVQTNFFCKLFKDTVYERYSNNKVYILLIILY